MKGLEINPHVGGQMIFNKDAQAGERKKAVSSQCWETQHLCAQRMKQCEGGWSDDSC